MKISLKNLKSALYMVGRAIESNKSLNILEGVKFDGSTVTGFNGEIGIEYETECESPANPGFVVNYRILNDAVKNFECEDGSVTLEADETSLKVVCGTTKMKLACLPKDSYPELPTVSGDKISLIKEDLERGIQKTVPFLSHDSKTRPILTGIHLLACEEKGDDGSPKDVLFVESTDAFRISRFKIPLSGKWINDTVIPGKAATKLLLVLKDIQDEEVTIETAGNQLRVRSKKVSFITSLLSGEFMDLGKFLNDAKPGFTVKVPVKKLLKSVDLAKLITTDQKTPVVLDLIGQKLTVHCATETGEVTEVIEASEGGGKIRIGFNPNYLYDLFTNLEADVANLELSGPESFMTVRENSWQHLMLPLRLKEKTMKKAS